MTESGEEDNVVDKRFLESLCRLSRVTWLWYLLWQARVPLRFTDLHSITGYSRTPLSNALNKLVDNGLARKVGQRYEAIISPAFLKIRDDINYLTHQQAVFLEDAIQLRDLLDKAINTLQ